MVRRCDTDREPDDALSAALPAEPRSPKTEIPFSSSRKWSALAFDGADAGTYVLGAPEMLQPALQLGDTLGNRIEAWSDEGLRVLLSATTEPVRHRCDQSKAPRRDDATRADRFQ